MDTKAVAELLGTDTRVLRRFIRDAVKRNPQSTLQTVGSGARYEFTEADIPELQAGFTEWANKRNVGRSPVPGEKTPVDRQAEQRRQDEAVWAEEGLVPMLEDIRDPRVRRRVQAKAQLWDSRLNDRLLAAGLHLSQMSRFNSPTAV